MCGVAGFWDATSALSQSARLEAIEAMGKALRHRGPDDGGYFCEADQGFYVAHRRLAVLDLSPEGHQPMASGSGRFVISFNGEIYNHQKLRCHLERCGLRFRGHSDTEVLLGCIDQWGLEPTLTRLNGMFAFALWDREQKELALVRDRLGIKPLYYGCTGGMFVWTSELKALSCLCGSSRPEVRRDAVALLLKHSYIPAPATIYQHIYKLLPGTWVRLAASDVAGGRVSSETLSRLPVPYWSLRDVAENISLRRVDDDAAGMVDSFEALLRDAISMRTEADVPVGAFLSGGIDSTAVVALMQQCSSTPVQTFSIGFHTPGFDEAAEARRIAQYLGTDHTELYISDDDARDVIPRLPEVYDEPFADSSQIPTFIVSELARRKVTVSLSGDGGDELLGGYRRYQWALTLWEQIDRIPAWLRRSLIAWLQRTPRVSRRMLGLAGCLLPKRLKVRNLSSKVDRVCELLRLTDQDQLYEQLVSHWQDATDVVLCADRIATAFNDASLRPPIANPLDRMLYADTVTYLPDDILVKVDRSSMACSLEARVPLLDHRLVEFAWSLPPSLKLRNGQGKWLLRKVLARHVPRELTDRPKKGFGVPIDVWLKDSLRDWAEALLDPVALREQGYFAPESVRSEWNAFLRGERDSHYLLWDVLMFQSWLARWH